MIICMFLQLNSTANQLLESNKYKRKDANNMAVIPSPLKKSPSKVTSESAATHQVSQGRRKRQFLITSALNTLNKIVHSPSVRHTPEISMPILISSSNTALIEKARFLSNTPNQVMWHFLVIILRGPQNCGFKQLWFSEVKCYCFLLLLSQVLLPHFAFDFVPASVEKIDF